MSDDERQRKVRLAESMWGGFVVCPHSHRTLAYLPGDDKVTCFCPQSHHGTHRVSELRRSDAVTWVRQTEKRKAKT